jgi:hypothetical protein
MWFVSWMLTGYRLKNGEGKLEAYNPKIGSRRSTQRGDMDKPRKMNPFNYEEDFFEAFILMKEMVEEIYNERGQQRG